MPKQRMAGFQKPLNGDRKVVTMAIISQHRDGVSCSCGEVKKALRQKVRDTWAEKHINKRHGGAGIWL